MADFYCDHQNTALYPTAYMSTPASAASLPQDGDGTVNGAGATPAVSSAVWDLTSASASSGTMTVMGATITGLTNSGSGLASAIATAINASTAITTAPNGNCGSVYLKALVWATSSGATLTVYSRIASVALNYANNAACAMAVGTGWTSPPATAQFSGGVSGPFAYMFTVAALAAAVSATVGTTAGSYGAMPATVMGAIAAGDKIHVRTKRGGANVTITLQRHDYSADEHLHGDDSFCWIVCCTAVLRGRQWGEVARGCWRAGHDDGRFALCVAYAYDAEHDRHQANLGRHATQRHVV
ncbi:MAG: hypothetical protein AW12_00865 [Candidatus Accumulibacter sp. BA-94]|nr:MAG: hypothetical protein AW12_00865 [Candidatus Accumulibacter sp. BA-94]